MISLLVLVLIVGVIYYVAQLLLPDPFPTLVLVIGLVIVLIALINLLGSSSDVDVDAVLLGPALFGRMLIPRD